MSGPRRVPSLVLLASTTGVGSGSIVTVAGCFVGAGGAGVFRADAMAVCPAVVSGLRSFRGFHLPR